MKNTPIDYDIVNETIDEMSIPDFGKAQIRLRINMNQLIIE